MKKGTFSLSMSVICGLCAAAWIVNCVKDFVYRTPGTVDGWHIALAVIWSAAFAVQLCWCFIERKKKK